MEEEPWIQLGADLSKKILRAGSKGTRAHFWSQVEVNVDGAPLSIRELRVGQATDEWSRIIDSAVQLQDEGEESQFRTRTRSDNSWTTFRLHFVRITSQSAPLDTWSTDELIQVAEILKEQGISLHRDGRPVDSFYLFSRALKLLLPLETRLDRQQSLSPANDETRAGAERIHSIISSLYNNLAACQLDQANFLPTVHLCDQALQRKASDVKALYRKGSALYGLRRFQESLDALRAGLSIEPSNKALLSLKRKVETGCKEQDAELAKGLKKYFQK